MSALDSIAAGARIDATARAPREDAEKKGIVARFGGRCPRCHVEWVAGETRIDRGTKADPWTCADAVACTRRVERAAANPAPEAAEPQGIVAKYAGRCDRCRQPFEVGVERIWRRDAPRTGTYRTGPWVHVTCPERQAPTPTPTADHATRNDLQRPHGGLEDLPDVIPF